MTASFTFHVSADQYALAPWLVVATDKPRNGESNYAAWACRSEHEAKLVTDWLTGPGQSYKRVRTVYDAKRTSAPKSGAIGVYDAVRVSTVAYYRECLADSLAREARNMKALSLRGVGGAA
jgi:hypothetical protein